MNVHAKRFARFLQCKSNGAIKLSVVL
ncbi:MAG: hypothetical protein PWP38_2565, partial [Clostridiales bacterium]|nr:hypothetical protein [Clostridiales bacterium]